MNTHFAALPEAGQKLVDSAVLEELNVMLGGEDDPTFLQGLLMDYFEDALSLLDQARTAYATADAPLLKQAVHTLKSSSAMFGAQGYADVCQEIEHIAATGKTAGLDTPITWLEAQFPQLKSELEALAF